LAHSALQDEDVNLIEFWRELDTPKVDPLGAELARLAMRIFSIVPNSAAVERLFSRFGIVHSKLRNRLQPEKVRKTVLIGMDTIERYGAARPHRNKRKLARDGENGPSSDPFAVGYETVERHADDEGNGADDPEAINPASQRFSAVVRELTDDLEEANEPELEGFDSSIVPAPRSLLAYEEATKLCNLFAYPSELELVPNSLDAMKLYWKRAKRGLLVEVAYQEEVGAIESTA
jgi:hypothetical protein